MEMKGVNILIDLQGIRNRAGMTQQQLANHIGVTRGQIANIETGVSTPSVRTASVSPRWRRRTAAA